MLSMSVHLIHAVRAEGFAIKLTVQSIYGVMLQASLRSLTILNTLNIGNRSFYILMKVISDGLNL